ncbi:MAG: terminase small subunit [Oscillospiraceae bacterium]|nr:terminase small subunit [Oscillospiraceae bacterium]
MNQKTGEKALQTRIREGKVTRADVTRRLAELAFGKANDCVRLALEDDPQLGKLDLSLLSEVKRNDKGTVEIKLIDRLQALEQLAQVAESDPQGLEAFLQALQGEGE